MYLKFIRTETERTEDGPVEVTTETIRQVTEPPEDIMAELGADRFVSPDREELAKYLRWRPKSEILDALCENEPEIKRGGLRGWLNRHYEEPKLPRVCPRCKEAEALTIEEVDELFGFRTMSHGPVPQSYCRECRTAHARQRRKEANNDVE